MLAEVIEGTFVDTAGIRSQSPKKETPHLPASSALCSPHPLDRLRGDERLILLLDTSLPFSLDTAQGPEKPFCAHSGSGPVLAAHGHAAAHIRQVLNAGPGVLGVGFCQGH